MTRLYHGSVSDFEEFKISENLLKTRKENLQEGLGIYFSTDENFAKNYGNFTYIVDINEKDCWDFTSEDTFKYFIKRLSKVIDIDLDMYVPKNTILLATKGSISVVNFSKEINLLLDSCEYFYSTHGNFAEEIFETISNEYKKILCEKQFLKYYDNSFNAVIYLCIHDAEKIKITQKLKTN